MKYRAEGAQRFPTSYTLDALRRAMAAGDILESRALSFDSEKRLHFRLGEIEAIMPYEECADGVREGAVRDIALITRVGRPRALRSWRLTNRGPRLWRCSHAHRRSSAVKPSISTCFCPATSCPAG